MSGESSVRSKRERKPVDVFKASPKAEKREEIIPEGEGIALGEIPFANRGLSKLKEDDEVLKSLHSLIFGGLGKAGDRKKKLRLFSGFDRDTEIGDKEDRVLENKKWTVMKLKQACDCFGLQKAGTREELCTRLVKYLAVPYVVKDISGATASPSRSSSKSPKGKSKTSKTVKKRKSRGKSTGSTSDGSTKKKRAPSGYILFSTAMRQEAKEEYPDASFTDLTKILGEKWNELEDEEKQVWLDKSEKLKNDLKEAEEEVEEEEEEEVEQEDNDEEEDAEVEEEEEEEESKENGEEKVEETEEKVEAAEDAEVEDEEGDKEEEEEQVFKKSKIEDEKEQQQIEDNEVDALVSDSLPDQTDNNESGPKVTTEEPAEVSEEVPVVEVTNENVVVEEVE